MSLLILFRPTQTQGGPPWVFGHELIAANVSVSDAGAAGVAAIQASLVQGVSVSDPRAADVEAS